MDMKNKVSITDRSIESAGIPKDYREAIAELIWNGFDAGASQVEIDFDANEIEHVGQIRIRDNGTGIDPGKLPLTFGTLLDSVKKVSYQRSSYIHGQKGKGRFSFTTFARRADWHTVCNPEGQKLQYTISIFSRSKNEYEFSEPRPVSEENGPVETGTEVVLSNLFGVTASSFQSESFIEFLCQQFGWFLFLNRKNNFSLLINGEELNYSSIIAEYDVKALILDDDENSFSFDLTFIRWKTRIGDRYYYYFLNQKKREVAKVLTSFNNNAIEFHHSLFIESDFFNDFGYDQSDPGSRLIGKNQSHPVFRALVRELNDFLEKKEQQFIRKEAANRLVREYNVLGIMPSFQPNRYEQAKTEHLEKVIKELYAIQPKLFKGLRREQQKAFVNMIGLLLDSDERSNMLSIIDQVAQIEDEDRKKLHELFEKDELFQVTRQLRRIEDRNVAVSQLQHFVESESLFEAEKEQIRHLVEENTWLLGETYHLTTANLANEDFLKDSLTLLDGKKKAKRLKEGELPHYLSRPHVFACRKYLVPDPEKSPYGKEENILIDVKKPAYVLSQVDHRQTSAYLRFVIKEPQLNGQEQNWKFFLIASQVDGYIRDQYKSYASKGKPFLIQALRNYEIYALTWRDFFNNYAQSHSFLLGKQPVERSTLDQVLLEKGIKL
jgi:hypothetical protein